MNGVDSIEHAVSSRLAAEADLDTVIAEAASEIAARARGIAEDDPDLSTD
jgi:hypothetical protein